ncbi:MAG: ADOP family duplicated permease [Gemmatimonadetes bacterium]|nr:ADOP family duplicated permease [Gemmatimonadota bacterium]
MREHRGGARKGHRLAGRPDTEREVEEELAFHLEERAEELRRGGVDREEAARRAREEFGDVEATRMYCGHEDRRRERLARPARFLRAFADELTSAARFLVRRPRAVVGPAAVLAVAVTLNVLVFTVVRGVLLTPLPFRAPDRVAVVQEVSTQGGLSRAAYPVLDAWRRQATTARPVAGYLGDERTFSAGGEPRRIHVTDVTAGFFGLLDRPILLGRAFTADEHRKDGPRVAMISEGLWRRAFGADRSVVGRSVRLDDREYTVVGVVRGGATFPEGTDVWLPVEIGVPNILDMAGAKIIIALASLRPGASLPGLTEEFGRISASVVGGAASVTATPVKQRLLGDVRRSLLMLQGAVLLVLLTACANAGGMLLARGVRRRGELAVRTSLGAGHARVAGSLLLEGLLLGGAAGVAGLVLAAGLLHPALALVPPGVPRMNAVHLEPGVALFALGVAALTGVVTSLAPALSGARTPPAALVRDATTAGATPRLRRLLEGFVVVQVALAVLLTVGAGLLLRSFVATVHQNPGFDPSHVTVVDVQLPQLRYPDQAARLAFAHTLLARADHLPGAQAVALGRNLPISGTNMTSPLSVEGSPKETRAAQIALVSAGYFDVMRIPIVHGSGFGGADREGGPPELVVDTDLRTSQGDAVRVGDRAHSYFGPDMSFRDVVGVAGGVRHADLRTAPAPVVYEPFFQRGGASSFSLLVRSDAPAATVSKAAQELVRSLDPGLPVDGVTTMDARISLSLARPRFYTVALSVFGALALLLALAGCQAGLAHRVAARRGEIGVRMALGASSASVRRRVLGRGLALTAAGAALGLLAAYPATRVLKSQLYGVTAGDPATYVGILALLAAAAALASDIPARRASSTDPAKVLREG